MRYSADSDDDYGVTRRGKKRGKFRYDEATYQKRSRHQPKLAAEDANDQTDGLPEGDRWSTWDQSLPTERGPRPHPKWLVTDLAAVDAELGVLKTGKEADVYLIRRYVPGTGRSCLIAAKRYRDAEHRLFHRDAGYLEGRRVRESRVNRATANRSAFGKQMIAGQWANAEFTALCRLHNAKVPVPYPVQVTGTEVLLEFIGDEDGTAAPRLAETRPGGTLLDSLWEQFVAALDTLARQGFAHGDLSPYNLLVHRGRLVLIDLPQLVDVVAHPAGREYLARDARNVATWFAARGLPAADPDALALRAAEQAGLVLAVCVTAVPALRAGTGGGRAAGVAAAEQVVQGLAGTLLGLLDRLTLPQIGQGALRLLGGLAGAQVVEGRLGLLGRLAGAQVVQLARGALPALALPEVLHPARRLLCPSRGFLAQVSGALPARGLGARAPPLG